MGLSRFFSTLIARANRGIGFVSQGGAFFVDPNLETALSNTSWELEARAVITGGTDYQCIFGRIYFGSAEYSMFYRQGIYAFDTYTNNSTGGLIYKEIPYSVPIGTWATVKFTYDGATLRGYIDDVLRYSEAIAFTINPQGGSVFRVGNAYGQYYTSGVIDYIKVRRNGELIVDIDFNEPDKTYKNKVTGSPITCEGAEVSVAL